MQRQVPGRPVARRSPLEGRFRRRLQRPGWTSGGSGSARDETPAGGAGAGRATGAWLRQGLSEVCASRRHTPLPRLEGTGLGKPNVAGRPRTHAQPRPALQSSRGCSGVPHREPDRAQPTAAFEEPLRLWDMAPWTEAPVPFPTTVRAHGRLAQSIGRNRRRPVIAGVVLLLCGLPLLVAQARVASPGNPPSPLPAGALRAGGVLLFLCARRSPGSGVGS